LKEPEIRRLLKMAGWESIRTTGGHEHWQCGSLKTTVPRHPGDLKKGLERGILKLVAKSIAGKDGFSEVEALLRSKKILK
jgi:predicted RNA binding protein YcfA (HicA-like mRNA interferase family)